MKNAVLLFLAVSLGAAAATAREFYQDSWKEELLEARAATRVELSSYRLQAAVEMYRQIGEQTDQGNQSRMTLDMVRRQLIRHQYEHDVAQLELAEVESSGQPPSRDVFGPLVSSRDFVAEYLDLERQAADDDMQLLLEHRSWLLSESTAREELRGVELEIANQEAQIRRIEIQLELREQFLDGELDPQQVQLEQEFSRVKQKQTDLSESLQRLLEDLNAPQEGLQREDENDMTVRYLRYQLAEMSALLQLADRELEILEKARKR